MATNNLYGIDHNIQKFLDTSKNNKQNKDRTISNPNMHQRIINRIETGQIQEGIIIKTSKIGVYFHSFTAIIHVTCIMLWARETVITIQEPDYSPV